MSDWSPGGAKNSLILDVPILLHVSVWDLFLIPNLVTSLINGSYNGWGDSVMFLPFRFEDLNSISGTHVKKPGMAMCF